MTILTEGNLQIVVNDAVAARKFDDAGHGLSHCMRAVDFIVELPDHYRFIEFKDPQHPDAPAQVAVDYLSSFQSGLIDEELKYKYRDSFLYEWAAGRADKPIDYLVLIALDTLSEPALSTGKTRLEQKIPLHGPGFIPWPRPILRGCGVFNLDSWNRHFPDYPVTRLP